MAVIALWVRSYWRADRLADERLDRILNGWCERGVICVQRAQVDAFHLRYAEGLRLTSDPVRDPPPGAAAGPPTPGVVRDWKALGFRWIVSRGGAVGIPNGSGMVPPFWQLRIPLWPLAAATLVLPTWRLTRRQVRRRRTRTGCCPACGYDLRATPQQCPECGTSATAQA